MWDTRFKVPMYCHYKFAKSRFFLADIWHIFLVYIYGKTWSKRVSWRWYEQFFIWKYWFSICVENILHHIQWLRFTIWLLGISHLLFTWMTNTTQDTLISPCLGILMLRGWTLSVICRRCLGWLISLSFVFLIRRKNPLCKRLSTRWNNVRGFNYKNYVCLALAVWDLLIYIHYSSWHYRLAIIFMQR